MYGKAGYKVTTKYFMAEKHLVRVKNSDFILESKKRRI